MVTATTGTPDEVRAMPPSDDIKNPEVEPPDNPFPQDPDYCDAPPECGIAII